MYKDKGFLLNQYRRERPTCFKPAKIGVIPRKSDSPLQNREKIDCKST